MNFFTQLLVLSIISLSAFSFAEDQSNPKFQVNVVKRIYSSVYHYNDQTQLNLDLKGFGIEGRYIYSPWTAIGIQAYHLNRCGMEENEYGLSCKALEPYNGVKLELLTGYNMQGQGVYIYTGTNYYWEGYSDASYGSFVVPLGIGANFKQFNLEIFTELRALDYVDVSGAISISDAAISDDEVESPMPFGVSLGYRF